MYSYALLETGCYYLIQDKEESGISLIRITMETDYCMFVTSYGEAPVMEWKKKTDTIHDILELMDDSKIKEWESIYNDSQDAYYEEDDE
ncbi:MAG: hypothetical protein EOO04_11555 [Chitinophagaceae bacterium]|nr:MAG: hypothetical protein EOO04_11555 [Chitinophagaceae bacterium]